MGSFMTSSLTNKKCRVVVVDPSGPVRQMMAETIRSTLGFEAVESKASVQDVLSHLESDSADWIVAPLQADQPVNALHLLKICSEHPELRGIRVSLLVTEEESYVLPTAFELGLFSYHHKPVTKDTLNADMKALFSRFESKQFNEPKTAAHYLRQYLKTVKNHAALAALEKNLLEVYPGDPQILLQLAEPQFHLGNQELAKKTLRQVKLVDKTLSDKVTEMAKTLFGNPDALADEGDSGAGINIIGVNNAVIIESDESTARSVEDILKQLGCQKINIFTNGHEAWDYLEKNPEPELIITEWRVPKLTGPLLIQRVRHHGFLNVPIIVLSSLLKPEDMPLVREISVADIIQKPINKDVFVPALIWTMAQERMPTEQLTLERKIRMLLKSNRKADAEPLRLQLFADKQTPMARKRLIEAEFAFANNQFALARDAAIEALKQAGDSIHVLNVLGKSFMRLSAYDAALKCFKKAQAMSPHNLERLCLIAETQTELGDHAAAEEALDKVTAIDPDSAQTVEAKVNVAITKGDSAMAKKILAAFESIDNIVAYMNNKAISLAKCGQGPEAIELYNKTLESIPDDNLNQKAIVLYNLSLGKSRDGDFAGAIEHLEIAAKVKESRVAKKVTSLLERLKTAQATGKDFKFRGAAAPDPAKGTPKDGASDAKDEPKDEAKLATEDDFRRMIAAVDTKRGDLCCFLIFHNPVETDARIPALLAKSPRFQTRVAIERAEVMLQHDKK